MVLKMRSSGTQVASRTPAWSLPHTKPWNDQEWKRDLLRLDEMILSMKGRRLAILCKLRSPEMRQKRNQDKRETFRTLLDGCTLNIQELEELRKLKVIEV
jgi:hypothetical protein